MYEDAMRSVHEALIQKSMGKNLTYIAELVPDRQHTGQMYVAPLRYKDALTLIRTPLKENGVGPQNKTILPASWVAPSCSALPPHNHRDIPFLSHLPQWSYLKLANGTGSQVLSS